MQKFVKNKKVFRPWSDSNRQFSDPKSDALSIRPQGRHNIGAMRIRDCKPLLQGVVRISSSLNGYLKKFALTT